MTDRRRVVFHVPTLRGGGAERVAVLMANEMARRGHDVTLFTWNAAGPNAALRDPAVALVDFDYPVHGERFGKATTLRGLVRSALFYRRLRPDIVFSGPEFANLVTALSLTLAMSPARFVPSFHAAAALDSDGTGSRLAIRLARLVAARATHGIAVSAGVRNDVVARGYAPEKVVVVHNPLPPAMERPDAGHAFEVKIDALGQGPVIVTAGRLVAVKDHVTMLRAFARLTERLPARLVIFGEGPLLGRLQEESRVLGIASRVLFAGYVNDPAACYAVADLFVLSSLTEGFGNVLVEAMAAGVPVVSTDAPHGPREILAGGELGELVPVGEVAALAAAMARTLANPVAKERLVAAAAEYSPARIGDRYEALIA